MFRLCESNGYTFRRVVAPAVFQRGIGSPGYGFRQIPSVHSRHRKQISVHSAAMRLIHSPKIREEVTETSSGTLFGQHGTDVKMETLIS